MHEPLENDGPKRGENPDEAPLSPIGGGCDENPMSMRPCIIVEGVAFSRSVIASTGVGGGCDRAEPRGASRTSR